MHLLSMPNSQLVVCDNDFNVTQTIAINNVEAYTKPGHYEFVSENPDYLDESLINSDPLVPTLNARLFVKVGP